MGPTVRTLAPSKAAPDAPLSPLPLDNRPEPATWLSGLHPGEDSHPPGLIRFLRTQRRHSVARYSTREGGMPPGMPQSPSTRRTPRATAWLIS